MNILNWIDDKGYQEACLDDPEALANNEMWRKYMNSQSATIIYDKMSDGCCHKTVQERCQDCSFREENNGSV